MAKAAFEFTTRITPTEYVFHRVKPDARSQVIEPAIASVHLHFALTERSTMRVDGELMYVVWLEPQVNDGKASVLVGLLPTEGG